MADEDRNMTAKEAIVQAVEELPDDCLDDLAHYVEALRHRTALHSVPTALASEAVLAKTWLRPDEDEAWRDL
jgi:hypothetical protein